VDLCRGPSRLCVAMDIEKAAMNKVNLTESEDIWLEDGAQVASNQIVACGRIGLGKRAGESAKMPLRFYLADCPYVSVVA